MVTAELVETTVFCTYHQIDQSFIISLEEVGLVELKIIDQQRFIPHNQLYQIERMIRLHRDLDINIAGIEAITHMLKKLEELQQENSGLKNRLQFYLQAD